MKRRILVSAVAVLAFALGMSALGDSAALGMGKGPKCTKELFCDPTNCEQLVCQGNPPCPTPGKCECVVMPGCARAGG